MNSISTCLFDKNYLLYLLGYGLYYSDPFAEWADSRWTPIFSSPCPVGWVAMVPNPVTSDVLIPIFLWGPLAAVYESPRAQNQETRVFRWECPRVTWHHDGATAFENLNVTNNRTLVIPSNFVKFGKIQKKIGIIRPNFDWRRFCIVKTQKTKNWSNLPINRTELAEIRSNSFKIRWNSRGYWSLEKN
jgi:hypothetical protein